MRDLINKLKQEKLYKDKLLPDILVGKVFPAIRTGWIGFYHYNGKLFHYDIDGFKTNIKYAAVLKKSSSRAKKSSSKARDDCNYILERDLKNLRPITNFYDDYDKIKKLCQKYAGKEDIGISKIYKKHSYALNNMPSGIMLLDIEVSFPQGDDAISSDFIDMLLFDKNKEELIFVEAKHLSNSELRGREYTSISVIAQIEKYRDHIKGEKRILKKYLKYIGSVNQLFGDSLPAKLPNPSSVYNDVLLLIFGYGRDEEKGKVKNFREIVGKTGEKIQYHPIGGADGIKLDNFVQKAKP